MARRKRKLLLSLLIVGALGSVASWGMYSAFTATTTNSGNTITAGSVKISQHSGAVAFYARSSDVGPGASNAIVRCVRVKYEGSLPASVKLYVTPAPSNATAFHLKVERGSGLTTLDNTMSCAGFTSSSTPFEDTLDQLGTSFDDADAVDGKASGAAWSANHEVDYRFTISVVDDSTPNAHTTTQSSGSHAFVWEARNN
jgi:hypothetical protein